MLFRFKGTVNGASHPGFDPTVQAEKKKQYCELNNARKDEHPIQKYFNDILGTNRRPL